MNLNLLHVDYDNIGRRYHFEDEIYYSVTSMLSATAENKSGLISWKKRLGKDRAAFELKKASRLGNDFHLLGEHWLLKKPLPKVTKTPTLIFKKTLVHLENHITKVIAVEQTIRSDQYHLAGRVDAVVEWDNQLAILDFKLLNNSDRYWLSDYWIQTSIYARAWQEMTGNYPNRLVLVIGNKKTNTSLFYKGRTKLWERKVLNRVEEFKKRIQCQN